jgi:hydrogenase small subunit
MSASRIPAKPPTIEEQLQRAGVSRRHFINFCGKLMVVAPFGLAITNHLSPNAVAAQIGRARRPSVIWLHMQECTGCTETLLRTSQPDLGDLILNVISLDYHETIMAPSGHDAELALRDAMNQNDGKYVVVVEGSIPTKGDGAYLKIAGKNGIDMLKEVTSRSAAVIAIGSCATWGGVQSSGPNPTAAVGVDSIVKNKPVVNIPGCPPNPYVLLGTVLEYATTGKLPQLDAVGRPKFAFDRTIHDGCPRRAQYDAGHFAQAFGDEGHRSGWCLFKLGCKGPVTHAPCSTRHFNEVVDCWPIGIGAPCAGCTEKNVAFTMPLFQMVEAEPSTRPILGSEIPEPKKFEGGVNTIVAGGVGVAGGLLTALGIAAARNRGDSGDHSSDAGDSKS